MQVRRREHYSIHRALGHRGTGIPICSPYGNELPCERCPVLRQDLLRPPSSKGWRTTLLELRLPGVLAVVCDAGVRHGDGLGPLDEVRAATSKGKRRDGLVPSGCQEVTYDLMSRLRRFRSATGTPAKVIRDWLRASHPEVSPTGCAYLRLCRRIDRVPVCRRARCLALSACTLREDLSRPPHS